MGCRSYCQPSAVAFEVSSFRYTCSSWSDHFCSGAGPEEHLRHHGIPVVKNLPGVGSHIVSPDTPAICVMLIPSTTARPPRCTSHIWRAAQRHDVHTQTQHALRIRGASQVHLLRKRPIHVSEPANIHFRVFQIYRNDHVLKPSSLTALRQTRTSRKASRISRPCRRRTPLTTTSKPTRAPLASTAFSYVRTPRAPCVSSWWIHPFRPTCNLGYLADTREWPVMRKVLRRGLAS